MPAFESEKMSFIEVAENLPQMFWLADPEGKMRWFSKNLSNFLGMSPEEINDGGWRKVTEDDDQYNLLEDYRNCISSNKAWEQTFYLKGQHGQRSCFMVDATPIYNGGDEVLMWVGTNVDITHLKEVEEELKNSDTRYRSALQGTQDIIYDWNLRTNVIEWNEALQSKLLHKNYPEKTRIKWWRDRVHPYERRRVTKNLLNAIKNKHEEWTMSYRFKKGDGNYAHILERGRILLDEDGIPCRMIGAMTDVTAEHNAVSRLHNAKIIAEKANETKSRFLASMSHEMRTPLSAIMGFVELMLRGDVDAETQKEFLCVIHRNGNHLLRIMEDVLDLTKVQSGMMSIKKERVDTSNLIKEACDLFKGAAKEKGITFRPKVDQVVPSFIYSDHGRLKQVIVNMVGNALKFTEHGEVTLKLGYIDNYLTIQVDDTGIGIPKNKQEYVFEPFTQAEASTHQKYGGTGLGLSLTRQICEALGGEFNLVSSRVGKGSCFEAKVFAPVCKDVKAPEKQEKKDNVKFEDTKILVVDDMKDNLILVEEYLKATGAVTHLASSGREALWLVRENTYDVILLDIKMPKMSGYQVIDAMKSSGVVTPIIALTANAMKKEREKALAAGFCSFITKPIDPSELYRVIEECKENKKLTNGKASLDAPLH